MANLIPDGSFEAGGWTWQDTSGGLATVTAGPVATDATDGSQSYEVDVTASTYPTTDWIGYALGDVFTVDADTAYPLAFDAWTDTADLVARVRLIWYSGGGATFLGQAWEPAVPAPLATGAWVPHEFTVTSAAGADSCRASVVAYQLAANTTGTLRVDDVRLTAPDTARIFPFVTIGSSHIGPLRVGKD